ncbi:hypothetical protein F0562_030190 [Nyssa sinensis]|uniref:Major facilitator superfamily (MFS) profile domain-containing protein n=1 Tax=Nyssa sinensis TaxID=561372 RepID=A0A5J5B0A3_9ASTE|nr:hypothetical protein F0562_030190 [Nyssa sinensis]
MLRKQRGLTEYLPGLESMNWTRQILYQLLSVNWKRKVGLRNRLDEVISQVNLSVAIIPMSHQFGWNSSTAGLVQSSFFWGYGLSQLPGGWLAKTFGGRLLLAPPLIQNFGWGSVFYIVGLWGIAWFLGFQLVAEEQPPFGAAPISGSPSISMEKSWRTSLEELGGSLKILDAREMHLKKLQN